MNIIGVSRSRTRYIHFDYCTATNDQFLITTGLRAIFLLLFHREIHFCQCYHWNSSVCFLNGFYWIFSVISSIHLGIFVISHSFKRIFVVCVNCECVRVCGLDLNTIPDGCMFHYSGREILPPFPIHILSSWCPCKLITST